MFIKHFDRNTCLGHKYHHKFLMPSSSYEHSHSFPMSPSKMTMAFFVQMCQTYPSVHIRNSLISHQQVHLHNIVTLTLLLNANIWHLYKCSSLDASTQSIPCAHLFSSIPMNSTIQLIHFRNFNHQILFLSFTFVPSVSLPSYHYHRFLPSLSSSPLKVFEDYLLASTKLQWRSTPKYTYQVFFTSVHCALPLFYPWVILGTYPVLHLVKHDSFIANFIMFHPFHKHLHIFL